MTTMRMEATAVAVKTGTSISANRTFMFPSACPSPPLVWVVGPRTVRSKNSDFFFQEREKNAKRKRERKRNIYLDHKELAC